MARHARYYLPLPHCPKGHKRTVKNTAWVVTNVNGYIYQIARCRVCMSIDSKRRYKWRSKQARQLEAAE